MQRSLLLTLLVALLLAGDARAETGPDYSMALLTENFPPYNMAADGKNFAQKDNIDGTAVNITREIFRRTGTKYNLTLRFSWDRIYRLALEKPGYGVFVTVRLAEREGKLKWVGSTDSNGWVLLAEGDSPITLDSPDGARKCRIGACKGDAIAELLDENDFEVDLALRDQENVQKLVKGQIDLQASGDPVGRYLTKQEGMTGLKTVLHFDSDQLYLAFSREAPDEVVQKLQAVLDGMHREGFIEDILNSYLQFASSGRQEAGRGNTFADPAGNTMEGRRVGHFVLTQGRRWPITMTKRAV